MNTFKLIKNSINYGNKSSIRNIHICRYEFQNKRKCQTEAAQINTNKIKTTITKPKEFKLSKDIKKYFELSNQNDILEKLPQKILRKKIKASDGYYLVNSETANVIAKHVKNNMGSKQQTVIEVNPGIGYLTKELLKLKNIQNLILIEQNEMFLSSLTNLQNQNEKRISLRKGDVIGMWKIAFQDKIDNGNRVGKLLNNVPKGEWANEPNVKIIANVGSINFIKHLINSIVFQTGLVSYGRPELHLLMPPPLYIHLTCTKKLGYLFYRSTTILFQIMFEHEFVQKIPRKHFFPWQFDYKIDKSKKLGRVYQIDSEYMYLTKISPRKNLHKICSVEHMPALWFFVKQHCISRKNKVIPSLERWIPGCGLRLITAPNKTRSSNRIVGDSDVEGIPKYSTISREISLTDFFPNINIFTEFGDLSPSQFCTLFDTFINWAEYKDSSFLSSMESSLSKLESIGDRSNNVLEIPDEDDIDILPETKDDAKKIV